MNSTFWKGRKVFLTGHTGFKGAWLSLWLSEIGANVCGYALEPATTPSLFELAHVRQRLNHKIGNILDLDTLRYALRHSGAEIVIHMAAQALVRESYVDPVGTYATNVMGTVNLLETVRGTDSVRVVLVVTSDKCYENREWKWGYREIDRLGGYDAYSNSKACSEMVVSSYRNAFFPPTSHAVHGVVIASARAGNVIGGGDWAKDRLIPDMMRAFVAGKVPVIRFPNADRPWQHVLEPLAGYLLLCEQCWQFGTSFGQAWNFGPDHRDAKPVKWVADRLTQLWGENVRWQLDDDHHPHEATYLSLDTTNARTRLGYRPRWGLEDALGKVVEWYKALHDGKPMEKITLDQIVSFMLAQPMTKDVDKTMEHSR
jgi:CDP-glucose 4,6-dehydratase